MVSKSHAKRRQDIKTKLMAAIAMLLVSSIMMVSSTYAWFTLSTAPEVTGISTSVGANGNLEMALMPATANVTDVTSAFGIKSEAGDGNKDVKSKNITWGNLVELSTTNGDDIYGLGQITLNPAAINMNGEKVSTSGFLQIPTYGSDGRVKELVANTVTATSKDNAFVMNNEYGVRAIGASSGMSERQYSFRNALTMADGLFDQANSLAAVSMTNNGSSVGKIAIKHAGDASAKHTRAEIESIETMLAETKASIEKIEEAYKYYLLVYAASSQNGYGGKTDEEINASNAKWLAVKGWVEAPNSTLESVLENIEGAANTAGVVIPSELQSKLDDLTSTKNKVKDAESKINALLYTNGEPAQGKTTTEEFEWASLSTALNPLINTENIRVNGYAISEVKANLGDLAAAGKVTITIPSGAGVYADIADHTGDYAANITVDVQYGSLMLPDFPARMEVDASGTPNNDVLYAAASQLMPENLAATDATVTISEFYGYIIDLAFRTNAASSNLLLRTTPADRIYSDNNNSETMGGGSTVTFNTDDLNFTGAKMKDLMKNIRIIFFDPAEGTIYAQAAIDTENAVVAGTKVTADIKLISGSSTVVTYEHVGEKAYDPAAKYFVKSFKYEIATGINAENFDAENLYLKVDEEFKTVKEQEDEGAVYSNEKTYYVKGEVYTATAPTFTGNETSEEKLQTGESWYAGIDKTDLYVQVTTESGNAVTFLTEDNAVITSLTQNEAKAISVLVYLDGNTITNQHVAAAVARSLYGSLNLQFASSATLNPMEYADLHQNGDAADGN